MCRPYRRTTLLCTYTTSRLVTGNGWRIFRKGLRSYLRCCQFAFTIFTYIIRTCRYLVDKGARAHRTLCVGKFESLGSLQTTADYIYIYMLYCVITKQNTVMAQEVFEHLRRTACHTKMLLFVALGYFVIALC